VGCFLTRFASCCGALVLAALPASALAQPPSPSASPSPQPGQVVMQQGVTPVAPVGPVTAGFKRTPATEPTRTYEGALKGVRALQIGDGEARLVLGGGERVVTPGTVIGTDTVKSITPGRIVLQRAAPDEEGGPGIVIVHFDPQGRTRVLVFATKDPTARVPPQVK
jgi:hypothetical protein